MLGRSARFVCLTLAGLIVIASFDEKLRIGIISAVAAVCPPLQTEIGMNSDGIPITAPREVPCPGGCDWRAKYRWMKNADGDITGWFECNECRQQFSVEEAIKSQSP